MLKPPPGLIRPDRRAYCPGPGTSAALRYAKDTRGAVPKLCRIMCGDGMELGADRRSVDSPDAQVHCSRTECSSTLCVCIYLTPGGAREIDVESKARTRGSLDHVVTGCGVRRLPMADGSPPGVYGPERSWRACLAGWNWCSVSIDDGGRLSINPSMQCRDIFKSNRHTYDRTIWREPGQRAKAWKAKRSNSVIRSLLPKAEQQAPMKGGKARETKEHTERLHTPLTHRRTTHHQSTIAQNRNRSTDRGSEGRRHREEEAGIARHVLRLAS